LKIAKVVGNVVSTVKHEAHKGLKLLIVQKVNSFSVPYGSELIAVDTACAGIGDYVLLADEGGASRMLVTNHHTPVDAVIVGVIDEMPACEE